METGDHLTAPSLKVEDPDIDMSTKQLEGGEDLEVGDDSLWENEVKLLMSKPDNCLLIDGCFFVRKWRQRRRRTGATRKILVLHQQQTTPAVPGHRNPNRTTAKEPNQKVGKRLQPF